MGVVISEWQLNINLGDEFSISSCFFLSNWSPSAYFHSRRISLCQFFAQVQVHLVTGWFIFTQISCNERNLTYYNDQCGRMDMLKALREQNGKYLGNRPMKISKSSWRERSVNEVRYHLQTYKRLPGTSIALSCHVGHSPFRPFLTDASLA